MVKDQSRSSEPTDPQFERMFIERERNRFANRALSYLVLLNGAAALVLLTIMAQAPESSLDRKLAAAMMFFSGGAIAALFSSFLAYVNRTVRMQAPARESLRRAVAAVVGSGAAFLTGMNMVGAISTEKSSSHPKGSRQDKPAKPAPIEKV